MVFNDHLSLEELTVTPHKTTSLPKNPKNKDPERINTSKPVKNHQHGAIFFSKR